MEDVKMRDELASARAVLADVVGWAKLAGEGVSVATFAGFNDEGQFMVMLSDARNPVQALSTVGLAQSEAGAKVVVAFEKANARAPIIIGRLQAGAPPAAAAILKVDGERVVLQAEQQIELRCGEASLVLTRAGKVLIRGNYVLSRSRGANKIKGAFVGIN